jgi:hypothetical protein
MERPWSDDAASARRRRVNHAATARRRRGDHASVKLRVDGIRAHRIERRAMHGEQRKSTRSHVRAATWTWT